MSVNIINPTPFLLLKKIPNNWSWGGIFANGIKGFLGGVYHTWFIVCIFDPILFFLFQPTKISCGPGLLMELICWPTSSYPYIGKIPPSFITIDGREIFSSISVCWYLDFVDWTRSPYNWDYHCFCLNHPLFNIIVVVIHTSGTGVILWLNWSCQVWREEPRIPISNIELVPIPSPPPLNGFIESFL